MRGPIALATAVVMAGSTAGCSYLFVRPLPESREHFEISCTASPAAPLVDLGIAGWQLVRTLVALTVSDAVYVNAPISRPADVGIGAGLLTLFGASMVYGFSQTGKCREALADENDRAGSRARSRGRRPPSLRLAAPPPSDRKLEEEEEEAAVRARMAERAHAARASAAAAPDAGALPEQPAEAPTVTPQPPRPTDLPTGTAPRPPVPQRADPE